MQCSAMSLKLKNQFTAAFAVDSLFPFFCELNFSLCGEKFFFARKPEKRCKPYTIRMGLRCCL